MNRRPDWHPSYGTPIPATYRDRVARVRDRNGIPHPRHRDRNLSLLTAGLVIAGLVCVDLFVVGISFMAAAFCVLAVKEKC